MPDAFNQKSARAFATTSLQVLKIMAPSTKEKRMRRKHPVFRKSLYGIVCTVAISLTGRTLPQHLEASRGLEQKRGPFFFAEATASDSFPSRNPKADNPQSHSMNLNLAQFDRRNEESGLSLVPNQIFRLPTTGGSDNNAPQSELSLRAKSTGNPTPAPFSRPTPAPVSRPTPAPVATPTPAPVSRPTPAPVPRPTPQPVDPSSSERQSDSINDIDINPEATAVPWADEQPQMEETVSPQEPLPWEDELNEDVEEIGEFCNAVQNQNHTAILAKEQAGEAGPSFLYSITVSVVHDEALVNSQNVPAYLNALNIPISLSLADCPESSTRRRLTKSGKDHRILQSSTIVEYSEVERWRDFTSSETSDGCAALALDEGLACGNYRSRVILFLVDGRKTSKLQDDFRTKVDEAIQTHQAMVTDVPGISLMQINSIAPIGVALDDGDTTIIASSTSGSSKSVNPLSDRDIIIAGSVAAGLGGLFMGLLCLMYWSRSSRCNNCYNKHSRFNDGDEFSDEPDELSPPKIVSNQYPYGKETVSRFPSFERFEARTDFPEEELQRNLSLSHRGDSYRKLNRVNSLIDSPNKNQAMSVEMRRASTLQKMRTDPTMTWSFDDEYDKSEDGTDEVVAEQSPYLCCNDNRPCSSATCEICENRRASGIERDEYLWFRELIAERPQRFDPTNPCVCSDTVQL